jgi:hypothetical protein
MVLLRDVGQLQAHLGPFGDNVNLYARWVHYFVLNVKLAQKSFWLHLMELLGDVGQEEAHFCLVGDYVNLGHKIRAWFAPNEP